MLFPNCSEICWRLNIPLTTKDKILLELSGDEGEERFRSMTSDYSKTCIDDMIEMLNELKELGKDINEVYIEYEDSGGGSTSWEFIEGGFEIARDYVNKKITMKEAREEEKGLYEECYNA